jgi:ATP-dependent helicase/nuclease subunit A
MLPALPAEQRRARGARHLSRIAPAQAAAHGAWLDEAFAVLAMPDAAPFFAESALTEVALSWAAPDGARIAGRIDRLCLGSSIMAVDFKTDALPPASAPDVPVGYLRQMAVYDAALRTLYPGQTVSLCLLWTATRALMPLPPALLADTRAALLDPSSTAT